MNGVSRLLWLGGDLIYRTRRWPRLHRLLLRGLRVVLGIPKTEADWIEWQVRDDGGGNRP